MQLKSTRHFTFIAHAAGWLIFLMIPVLLAPGPGISQYFTDSKLLAALIIKNLVWMMVFYANMLYLMPAVISRKNTGLYLFMLIVIIFFVSVGIALVDQGFYGGRTPELRGRPDMDGPLGPGRRGPGGHLFGGPFFSNVLITLIMFAVSSLIVLWNDWQRTKALEQERALQKVAAELSMLKLQISPHFLFNTLNNIRWLVRSGSEFAEPAVVKLSQLLRYIIYQTNTEYVSLSREIEVLRDYISLQEMRLSNREAFSFTTEGTAGEKKIVPLLFIPIAENFFKYGDFEGGYVNTLQLQIRDNAVTLVGINKIAQIVTDPNDTGSGGIGLDNLKRRLELHYPGRHELNIVRSNDIFSISMKINLG